MIVGILSLSNGVGLKYPFPPVIVNLSKLCDHVLVGIDPNFPEDLSVLEEIKKYVGNISIVHSPWDRDNIKNGIEIALQMDSLVSSARELGASWVVVPQADELFLDDDFSMLRAFMDRASERTTGFSVERLYFWGAFDKIRKDWNARMVRIFRPGTFSFTAEGTDKAGMYAGPIASGEVVDLPYKLYHYSRMGDPKDISKRIRNLDGFFHPADTLMSPDNVPEYDFVPRAYDNYAVEAMPAAITGEFDNYNGKHPAGIKEWFGESNER